MALQPIVDGWFTTGDEPALIGRRCPSCGTYAFPPARSTCPNPRCDETELETVELSRRGRVWSWTTNHYSPPAPYVAADPFEPYTIVAAELVDERMVVLGQLDGSAEELKVDDEVELTVSPLDAEHVVWKWRRADA